MKVARFVLKIVAMSLTAAALACAVVAYWNELLGLFGGVRNKLQRSVNLSEYDDYEE